MTRFLNLLSPRGETATPTPSQTSQEVIERRTVMILFRSGDNRLELPLPTETDPSVITETSPTVDSRENPENMSIETDETDESAITLIGNTALAAIDPHAHVAARHGGSEARHPIAARYPAADQDPHQTHNRPIRDGLGRNTDLNIPNMGALAFIVNPAHLQFGVHPIRVTAKKHLRRQTLVLRKFGAMILKVIQTPWKTLLAPSFRRYMVKLLSLFDRVAGAHTNPAPAR